MGRRTELEDLRDETLMEILVRTPINTAHLCKCVSKRWYSLVSHPYFVNLYCRHNTSNVTPTDLLLIANFGGQLQVLDDGHSNSDHHLLQRLSSSFDLIRPQDSYYPRIYSVSHDLVLIGCHDEFYVCNPFINQAIKLPPLEDEHVTLTHLVDPSAFLACVCSDDYPTLYKVVLLTRVLYNGRPSTDGILHIYVFSSDNTREWSGRCLVHAPLNFTRNLLLVETHGQDITTLNGVLYCCGMNMIFVCNPFNLNQQCYFIDLPEDAKVPYQDSDVGLLDLCSRTCITTVEQHLRLYVWRFITTPNQELMIWDYLTTSTTYNNYTWSKKHNVDLTSINWPYLSPPSNHSFMCIESFSLHDGDVLYVLSWDKNLHRLLSVNLRSKTVQLVSHLNRNFGAMFCYAPRIWPTPVINTINTTDRILV